MNHFTIRPLLAVGMHHYGRRELSVGSNYHLEAEPLNKYDSNAVAIYDGSRKVGNLKKEYAEVISSVMKLNLAKSRYVIRPIESSEVKSRKTGPQQLYHLTFKGEDNSEDEIRTVVKSHQCVSIIAS
ncbi:Hypothetical predicted protein [Mytilus galloprovincialis]|uniref:HIRAN domain-containing protein n=1 Tax=Mytilus galloprovincialis TaxID=29158 RepID=A0A8B6GQ98_MYTGA|nr:Hypothetical predicted protein [Mytilus galloprovincialis]